MYSLMLAIRGVAVVVFLGYLFIWIMISTNVYRLDWQPKMRADTNSTYFGTQGTNILIFTFPVLFMAVMGSVYLHLMKKISGNNPQREMINNHKLAIWRRPMIIKSLGIVSRIELAFFVMFIALLVWSYTNYVKNSFAKITPASAAKKGEEMWETKLDTAAERLGVVGNIVAAFLFFPVTRGSSVLPLFGLTSEASVKYHIWLGHIVMTLFTAHGICYFIYWAATHQLSEGVAVVVFLGYLFIWIMISTNVYKLNWQPKMRADTASTYFGTQGTNILIFTFPVLFIAVAGSVYLHLKKKISGNNHQWEISNNHKLAIWRRPMIIKGLGIVSRIELAFFVMFIALLVWSFTNYVNNSFAKITPKSAAKAGEEIWEAKLDSAALRLGLVGNIVLAFLFFPVTRGSSVLPLFGLTSEASVKYHIWLGHIVMTLFTAHGICYIIYWAATHQLSEMVKWAKADISNVAGELSLVFGLVLWATTYPRIRRKMFELFFYTHYLYILFIFFFVLHVGISYSCIMLPGFYLFLVDRFLRFLQSRQSVRLLSSRVLPCETLELNFSKSSGLSYTPTSIMFMNVPSISKVQWHPFTISSSSNLESDKLSVIIKGEGSWSKKLHQILSSPSSVDRLDISIEGPYGPASTDFLRHDTLVMVSGGSGITPFISIFRELVFASETQKTKAPRILLITSFKNSTDLTMLELLLPISYTTSEFSKLELQIEAYVTREQQPATIEKKTPLRTVWFKPNPSDSPITPILGQNSSLWLGAIISSSFVIFLIFMGLLTRFYIYPIDHNTNDVFSYSTRAVLNMLLICVSIAITSSACFLWNKKNNAMDINQIQNMEGATPVASPNSWYYNPDRELESLPQQSLAHATNVHYGERPNLKKILFERKESSVGVLVCGPKKMRHEVANICSSGLAANLHFESISFSW